MPLAEGSRIAGYTIQRMLGSGGMGEVYLAQHPRLPRQDAIKVLRSDISGNPDFVERFNREADLAAALWHPHIVGIHDRGSYRGRLWISMDFVDGTDAGRLLDRHPSGLPVAEALEIVRAVASALDYAHERGLLHRDVKPANILVAGTGLDRRILLSDFGIARVLADDTGNGLTATNMTVGTAAYAAPEQLMGLDLDGRADQYSLAVTAYHLLTGKPPFRHSNAAVVIGQHLNASPPALADSNPELAPLDPVMARALAKDPADRFPTCLDFARALEAAAAGVATATMPAAESAPTMVRVTTPEAVPYPTDPTPVTPGGGGRSRWRWGLTAAAAVVATAGVVAYFAVARSGPVRGEPFTLTGSVQIPIDQVRTTGLPEGYKCAGDGALLDVSPNAPVTVEDESGTLLAKGAIRESFSAKESCTLAFRVDDVPSGARFYRVQVAHQPESSFTEAEAKAGVEIPLVAAEAGPKPTPSTSPAPSSAKPSPPPTQTATATPDADANALRALQRIAADDYYDVRTYFTDIWVPQISSKRVGLRAEGKVWSNADILDEHLRLRARYPDVKLLWSGDWSTFDAGNFWVTIVGLKSPYYTDVLDWCRQQGFDRDHCLAKMVSTWRPVAGTTKLLN